MAPKKPAGYIPTVRGRRLIRGLIKARESAHLGVTQAAKQLDWSQSRLSRIETFQSKPRPAELHQMLDLYGVTSPVREALLALAAGAEQRGWWTDYLDVFSGGFIAYEDAADSIREWAPLCIPGLFQTREYARAIIAMGQPMDEDEARRKLTARMLRQELLTRNDDPVAFHAIIDESLLRRPIGGQEVLRDQLYRLRSEMARPNVTIQILPMQAEQHAGLEGHFIVMSFAEPDEPDVGYTEGIYGAIHLENPPQVDRCNDAFDRLSEQALSQEESEALIQTLVKE